MTHQITILPANQNIRAPHGANLLELLRREGHTLDAPCGGNGHCGKCRVSVDGQDVLACCTNVDRDMEVLIPDRSWYSADCAVSEGGRQENMHRILTEGVEAVRAMDPVREGYLLAVDIGTTTVVGYLLDGETGRELAAESRLNPQTTFGADVISRIQAALKGQMEELTSTIRGCVEEMIEVLCEKAGIGPERIGMICPVGNPAMQQFFLGISPQNLAQIPFAPVLTEARVVPAGEYLPVCKEAVLVIVPDISGFVGADTLACVLATELDKENELTLMVDIGTNGEMVLGNRERMVACSTAAGPALEGANIQFGMRGMTGAIDHIWVEDGEIRCSVIGDIEAVGICGSGLIDAVAAALDMRLINERGRVQTADRCIHLTDKVYLTQEDIREVQMAKGAIAAGIELMAEHLGIELEAVGRVYLAGAFGNYMDAGSACRIKLLPPVLKDKIIAVGNAAGSGAKQLVCHRAEMDRVQKLTKQIEFLELASVPQFQYCFARNMRF